MAEKQVDVRKKDYIAIGSVPAGINDTLQGSISLEPGERGMFFVTIIPDDIRLALWDPFFSIFIDTNAHGYIYPGGTELTTNQRSLDVGFWPDWGTSSDLNNIRAYTIKLWNQDYLAHTYYLRFKAYTFATVPGSS